MKVSIKNQQHQKSNTNNYLGKKLFEKKDHEHEEESDEHGKPNLRIIVVI
jgi:hypothetical protein